MTNKRYFFFFFFFLSSSSQGLIITEMTIESDYIWQITRISEQTKDEDGEDDDDRGQRQLHPEDVAGETVGRLAKRRQKRQQLLKEGTDEEETATTCPSERILILEMVKRGDYFQK